MGFTKRVVSDVFLSETALSIWAKTNFWHSAPPEDVGKQWLPLAVHMADSGEVAELIWDNYLSPRQSREHLRQIQEPVAFPQLVSDLDNLVTELLAKGE